MNQLDIIRIVLRLCLLNFLVDWSNAAAFKNPPLIGGQGLYNASDDVVILNATNFKSSVYGSTRSWLVEFYNSWCGFCYRFAPTWKALASDILCKFLTKEKLLIIYQIVHSIEQKMLFLEIFNAQLFRLNLAALWK